MGKQTIYQPRASNQAGIYVILRSEATKNLKCLASTLFQLSMTFLGLVRRSKKVLGKKWQTVKQTI
jgi:hypothetical protein